MAYLTIARFSGEPEQLLNSYRGSSARMSEVGRDHGLIFHAATATDEGFLVINLWESEDGSEAAARDPRRQESLQAAGLDPSQIRREHYELENYEIAA
jgi:hypothetical protein